MNKLKCTVLSLAYQLAGILFLYFLCRLLFIAINQAEFNFPSFNGLLFWFLAGLRFDLSAVFLTNSLFILIALLPLPIAGNKYYKGIKKALFIIPNSFFLLLNCIDIAYYPFVHKRMSADAVLFITGQKGTEFFSLLPGFIVENWYVLLFYIAVVALLVYLYKRSSTDNSVVKPTLKRYVTSVIALLLISGITVLSIRGGLQKKPLNVIHASEMVDVQYIPIVLNTPFTVIKTYNKKTLNEIRYFLEEDFDDCEKALHSPAGKQAFNRQNVVIIIVESLSKNYVSYFDGAGKTPFLDSLFAESMVFPNGFANAKESIQGIPAVLSAIPSLQDEPFIFSYYATNRITSVANLLKKEGYNSSFFHGGANGTMGFNSYSSLAGFDRYVGRDEYNNEKDFDGNWGIWDEPFLQFMGKELSKMPQPFVSSVFTLNTHHPFIVPAQYKDRFKQTGHAILPMVEYADYSLAQFFKFAKTTDWYKNTLFVITADHTGPKINTESTNVLDDYLIPIVFFKPDGSLKGADQKIANQIDILPSLMHLLGYPHPFFSQGKNLFADACDNFAVNYNSGVYQYIDSTYCYQFDGQKQIGFYNWKTDAAFKKNLTAGEFSGKIENSAENLKKFIQTFNNSMISNKMMVEPSK